MLLPKVHSETPLIYQAKEKNIQLTEDDKDILDIGEISQARYITGGILGTYPIGFGVGHAIQGRWTTKGWIFTAGELGTLALAYSGLISCLRSDGCSNSSSNAVVVGALGFIGLRIWEIVDVWATPPSHNQRYKDLKEMIEKKEEKKIQTSFAPILVPEGGGVGFRILF